MGCLQSQDKGLLSENKSLQLQIKLVQFRIRTLSKQYELSQAEVKRLEEYNKSLVKMYNELLEESKSSEHSSRVLNRASTLDQMTMFYNMHSEPECLKQIMNHYESHSEKPIE